MADSKLKIWITDHYDGVGIKKLTTSLGKVKSSITKAFSSKPVRNFKIAVLAVTGALVGLVREEVKLNVSLARTNTMAGGGIKNFIMLRKQAKGLASDYGLAASSISKGMYDALSAGVSKANLEGLMNTAAQVAVADGSDISTAVDGITTVLNAFGYSAEDSEEVADKLFQTVKQGKTTFAELASNIATVAPMAAASNIPLEQILAHVASLTASGTPTAQAMTQIRASIQGMNKALGDGWSDNMTYQEALKKVWSLAGESQTELLKMVGSTEAVQAVLGGVGEKAKMADEKLRGMADSAGATKEAFEEVNQFRHWEIGFHTVLETLKKLGGEIDKRLAPYVRKVTEEIKKWQEDEGLWDKIRGFLDGAESKLKSVAEIAASIKSTEDLKFVAGVIGEYIKQKLKEAGEELLAYLSEKAPIIGEVIGAAIKRQIFSIGEDWKAIGGAAMDRVTGKSDSFIGAYGDRQQAQDEAARAEGAALLGSSSGTSSSMSWDDVVAKIKQGTKEGLAEAAESSGATDTGKFLAALEAGLTGQELDKAIEGLDLMKEDQELLADYMESLSEGSDEQVSAMEKSAESVKQSAEAAKKTAEEATKASTANVDSHVKVQDSMRLSSEAALKTAQVADRSQQQIGQAIVLMQQLAAAQAETGFRLAQAESQIVSMRS